jgi:hypothetical protein
VKSHDKYESSSGGLFVVNTAAIHFIQCVQFLDSLNNYQFLKRSVLYGIDDGNDDHVVAMRLRL